MVLGRLSRVSRLDCLAGPLLTLLKAATAVARAKEAQAATGVEHVPVFWLASEDHDLAEVDQVSLLSKHAVETLRLGLHGGGAAVGGLKLGQGVEAALDQVSELAGLRAGVRSAARVLYPGGDVSRGLCALHGAGCSRSRG